MKKRFRRRKIRKPLYIQVVGVALIILLIAVGTKIRQDLMERKLERKIESRQKILRTIKQ